MPVIRLEQALAKRKFIVVASSEKVYFEIKRNLESYGLEEFHDFTYYKTYKKKVAVIYGNCHIIPIKEALMLSDKFNDEYGFYPLPLIQEMTDEDLNLSVYERCDLFFHQSIRKENRYGEKFASEFLVSKLKDACQIYTLPNLYGLPKCFYPQVYINKLEDWKKFSDINIFPYADKYIDTLVKEKYCVEDIVNSINSSDFIRLTDIQNEWDTFIEKLYLRQNEWDIRVSDYILGTYKETQLFYDPYHPTNEMMKYIILELYKLLNLDGFSEEKCECLTRLDCYEVPIYKAVSDGLQLEYSPKVLRKYAAPKYKIRYKNMDVEEYVREYITWHQIK